MLIIPLVGPKSGQTSPSHGVFFFFTRDAFCYFSQGARLFLYSHEVARKRFPRIAFSFSLSDFLHAFQMRFFGILFCQLFYPFGDGPCSFRNSRNHCVDPFPRLGTLFSSSSSSSSFRRHDWLGVPSRLSFLCLFEVQRDNGMAVAKLDQVASPTNRFGHLNVNDFHHLVSKR